MRTTARRTYVSKSYRPASRARCYKVTFRPHHTPIAWHWMRSVATHVAWSVCLSVCRSQVSAPQKATKLIEMLFGSGLLRPEEPSRRYQMRPGSPTRRGTFGEWQYLGILRLTRCRYCQPYSQSGISDVASAQGLRLAQQLVYFAVLVVLFIELFHWLVTWNRHSQHE